jgi:tRNA dimethylallyltransferase
LAAADEPAPCRRTPVLVGPTGIGKTAVGVELARLWPAMEVISADSRQIYRRLDVGTAKPSVDERARVAHHCLDLVEPGTPFDVSRFRAAASAAIADIDARGRLAVVAGGTGLYVRVLLRGLCPAPPASPVLRMALRRLLAVRGAEALHRALQALDPESAARLAPRDGVRIVRALEVSVVSGIPLSRWQAEHGFAERPYEALVIGLVRPTPELDARIAARARAMVAGGLVDEVRRLRDEGLAADAPGLCAVGYPELRGFLDGRTNLESALGATILATRRFAKRQRTWFRREPDIRWHHPEHEREAIMQAVEAFVAGATPAMPARA